MLTALFTPPLLQGIAYLQIMFFMHSSAWAIISLLCFPHFKKSLIPSPPLPNQSLKSVASRYFLGAHFHNCTDDLATHGSPSKWGLWVRKYSTFDDFGEAHLSLEKKFYY